MDTGQASARLAGLTPGPHHAGPGRNAAHCPGWPPASTVLRVRTPRGRACGAPLTPEPLSTQRACRLGPGRRQGPKRARRTFAKAATSPRASPA
jgi:hypothetical protein